MDKLTTENEPLEGTGGGDLFNNPIKAETLEDLVSNFKEIIMHKKLQER